MSIIHAQHISNRLFNNCIKSYINIRLALLEIWIGRQIDHPLRETKLKKHSLIMVKSNEINVNSFASLEALFTTLLIVSLGFCASFLDVFYKKTCSQKFHKIRREKSVPESFF